VTSHYMTGPLTLPMLSDTSLWHGETEGKGTVSQCKRIYPG